MRILFVTGNMDESHGGGQASQRNYHALETFSEVDVYQIIKKSTAHTLFSIIEGIYPPCSRTDVRKLRKIMEKKKYDIVFVDRAFFGLVVKEAKKCGMRVAVFFHNCEHDYNMVRFADRRTLKSVIYQYLVDKAEKQTVMYSDYKMVFTERDRGRIENLYSTKVDAVVPIGMIDRFDDRSKLSEDNNERYCLLFGPCLTANKTGYEWFVKNVSPKLNCKTLVAGKGFERYIKEWETDKVQVKGFVANINILYNKAACVAIPLFSGGGMKIKTSEALMFGKYIFGTEEAFIGYDLEYDTIGALCSTADEFIQSINMLLGSKMDFFNTDARQIFLDKYEMSCGAKIFKQILGN